MTDNQHIKCLKCGMKQRGFYGLDFAGFFIALVVVGALIGVVLTLGLPWLWELVRPFIHEVTR